MSERVMPKAGVVEYEVHTADGTKEFRRAGILFTKDPQKVAASSLSEQQQIELLNTHTLVVKQITAGGGKPAGKPAGAGEGKDAK